MNTKLEEQLAKVEQLVRDGCDQSLVLAEMNKFREMVDDEVTEAFTRGQNNLLECGYHL